MALESRRMVKKHDQDMTEGNIVKLMLAFMLPLLLGNIFQQLYNTVDTWVVGNYASNEAFSAVGSVTPIVNMLIGAFMGLASGAGVVISQYYGAGDYANVKKAVHTSLILTAILTVAFTAIGVSMTPLMLHFMKIPDEVFPEARDYLVIYFAGMIGLLFYNMGSGIMRAVGDSRRPFIYLVVCALINTVLDLIFVIKFSLGVRGVAYATILSQIISAILTIRALAKSDSCVKISFADMKCDKEVLRQIIRVGIPAALQMAITAFSNVFVQGYINSFGADVMGGWTAYLKLDSFLMLPVMSLALTSTTFVGQNIGKNQVKRAKKGVWTAFFTAIVITVSLGIIVMIFAPELVAFFNEKPEVVAAGTTFLHWLTPFYFLTCVNQIFSGALRGAGHSTAPMIIMLVSFVAFRQIYMFVMSHYIANTIITIGMGYPAGWLVCGALTLICFFKVDFGNKSITSQINK